MIRHTETSCRVGRLLTLLSLALACLTFSLIAAGGAKAFTGTIADIEDPSVEAKVLGLQVQATRTLNAEHETTLFIGPGPRQVLDTAVNWNQALMGRTNDSLTEQQQPKITVQRNPTVVTLGGKVVTDQAEGNEQYSFIDGCLAGLTTTKSPLLDVALEGFYQSGTSSSSGNPEVSLSTENLDPFVQSCPSIPQTDRATVIQAFATPTVTNTVIGHFSAGGGMELSWTPVGGDLTTTTDACTPEYCDFTISGRNRNDASISGWSGGSTAVTTFKLRLRLQYPSEPTPEEPVARAKITKHPGKVVRMKHGKTKVTFAFKSDAPAGTRFKCRLDGKPFAFCTSPFKSKVTPGKHRFAVVPFLKGKATGTPTVYKWKVKKVRG